MAGKSAPDRQRAGYAGQRVRYMALTARLQLKQSQTLVMTPQLMQSIKLLQLTHVELERFVDEEIERNPLLDRAEPRDDAAADLLQKQEGLADEASGGDWFESERAWTSEAISDKLDSSLENIFPDDPGTSERLGPDLTAQWKSAGGNSGGGSKGIDSDTVKRLHRGGPQSPWSHLRDKERDPVFNAIKDKFPGRYEQLIEQYYKSFDDETEG